MYPFAYGESFMDKDAMTFVNSLFVDMFSFALGHHLGSIDKLCGKWFNFIRKCHFIFPPVVYDSSSSSTSLPTLVLQS